MRHQASLYLQLISIQIRSQMQYRVSFWLEMLSTGLLNASYFIALVLVLERFGNIVGWSLGEVAFLAGMVEMSFSAMDMIFSGFDAGAFSRLVRMGGFDQMLLRPVNITLQVFGSRFEVRRLGRFLEGVVIFIVALTLNPIHWTLVKLLYLPVVFASQVVAFGALFIVGSTLTFWTVEPVEAVNILTYGGNELLTYPATIYPTWLQRFFTFVVPLIFLNFFPALFFLEKNDPLGFPGFTPFLAPAAALAMIVGAGWFWRFGVNHYQSTGS